MKLKKIDLPQQPKTYQDGINLYSLINFKDFFAPLFATGDIKSVCEIGVEVGSFTQWLADQAKLTGFKYYGVDPQVGAATQKLCPELDFISKKSTDYLADHHVANHDVYFIDGDHNFYTVYNELQLIFSNPLQAQKICFLHDIGWPCGRRDWYYNINDIPAAARHEHTHDGRITLGESALSPFGFETCGRAALALHEGGANNGVLTAIEKFIETHADGRAITFIKIPIFYGLGTVSTGFFPCDFGCPADGDVSLSQFIHNTSGFLVYAIVPFCLIGIGLASKRQAELSKLSKVSLICGVIALAFVVLLFGDPKGAFIGFFQRIIEGSILFWAMFTSFYILRTKNQFI